MKKYLLFSSILLVIAAQAQTERWIYEYNGPGNNADEACSIIYGPDNNLYMAGVSFGLSSENDLAILSIDTSGTERWVYRYDGPSHQRDGANGLAMGDNGDLYAAGWSRGISGDIDITVAAVDSGGNEKWVYRYNGTANYVDNAYSITTGLDGNIYAAGFTFTFAAGMTDFIVISLTPSDSVRWIYKYDGGGRPWNCANAVIYGPDNRIYAAGFCGGSTGNDIDFAVICLDTTGNEEWIYAHDGPGHDDDEAMAIVYGNDNNLYAAGYSSGASSDSDFVIISIDTAGGENWVYRYNGSAYDADRAKSIIYGNDDNLYAAGYATMTGASRDYLVISVDSSGGERWVYTYNGPDNFTDEALTVSYGADNNIYTGGFSFGSGTREDFTVISLDSNGNELGVYRHNGSHNLMDQVNAIMYGPDNYVYAAGMCFNDTSSLDLTVISFDPVFGIKEQADSKMSNKLITSTIFTGPIVLPVNLKCKIYDITGRQIHTPNPVPGIYFIEVNREIRQKVIKIK